MPSFSAGRRGRWGHGARKTAEERPRSEDVRCCRAVLAGIRCDARALIKRADELMGCTEDSREEEELRALADVIDAYEAKRWPSGKIAGGKG